MKNKSDNISGIMYTKYKTICKDISIVLKTMEQKLTDLIFPKN